MCILEYESSFFVLVFLFFRTSYQELRPDISFLVDTNNVISAGHGIQSLWVALGTTREI